MSNYTPEQVEQLVRDVSASNLTDDEFQRVEAMAKAYAATLRQQGTNPLEIGSKLVHAEQAGRVDEAMVELACAAWNEAAGLAYVTADRNCMRAALQAALAQNAQGGGEAVAQAEKERDFLVEEYERAVGCGPQGYLHAAMHLFNAITNAQIDARIAERARVPAEVSKALEFYANGGHDLAVHIRNRKKGEPDGYAWWSMKRKQPEANGYSFYGEDRDGTERYIEDGSVAQAALGAVPTQPEDAA